MVRLCRPPRLCSSTQGGPQRSLMTWPQPQQGRKAIPKLGRQQVPHNPGLRAAPRSVLSTSYGVRDVQCSTAAKPLLCLFECLCSTAWMSIPDKGWTAVVACQGWHGHQAVHLLACGHAPYVVAEDKPAIEPLPPVGSSISKLLEPGACRKRCCLAHLLLLQHFWARIRNWWAWRKGYYARLTSHEASMSWMGP